MGRVGVVVCSGAWSGRGESAQTHRAGSAGGPAVSLQLREAMGRFAAALVGSLFWLGLLLCGLGSLASAEPRAPPNRIGRCGGYRGAAMPRSVFPGLGGDRGPETGPCAPSLEECHWRRVLARDSVSVQLQPGRPSALAAERPQEPASSCPWS